MISTYSLFDTVYAKDSGGDYGGTEVRWAAKPHVDYLVGIRDWHKARSVSWDVAYQRSDRAAGRVPRTADSNGARRDSDAAVGLADSHTTGRAAGDEAGQDPGSAVGRIDKRQRQTGIRVSLEGIDDAKFERIADEIEASLRVYEHDRDGTPKAQRGEMIKVTGFDKGERLLWLERSPRRPHLRVAHNTHQIESMLRSLRNIMHRPHRSHMPLRALFRENRDKTWPNFKDTPVDKWFFLNRDVEGLDEQRQFVQMALGTPDFAFLEGPPGSGKTTALCELVMQVVSRGKRVLFCASTHVAVDNLLERLADAGDEVRGHLTPIRIGVSNKISDEASRHAHDRVAAAVEEKIQSGLAGARTRSRAQESMQGVLDGESKDAIGRMTRDHANLVCGTTIGILAHPDIRSKTLRRFDIMIIDEASKTTLQEFLVPAAHAGRWVIVGDMRQLVPHVDQDDMALQVEACMDEARGAACLDAFMAKKRGQTTVVACSDPDAERAYAEQCEKLGIRLRRPSEGGSVGRGEVLIGPEEEVARVAPERGNVVWRGKGVAANAGAATAKRGGPPGRRPPRTTSRRGARAATARRGGQPGRGETTWAGEVAWRISIHWPGMTSGRDGGADRLRDEVEMLMPQPDDIGNEVRAWLASVRRIAVPSVLDIIHKAPKNIVS